MTMAPKQGKPLKPEERQLSLRVTQRILDRADALIDSLADEDAIGRTTRSDVLRAAMLRGLKLMEKEA